MLDPYRPKTVDFVMPVDGIRGVHGHDVVTDTT